MITHTIFVLPVSGSLVAPSTSIQIQKTDVAITKSATARVTLGSDGKAAIVYDMRITNNGPAPAANVTASDAAPTGVTFTTIATQPSQGSCSVANGGALVNCSVGTMAVGQSLAFTVK